MMTLRQMQASLSVSRMGFCSLTKGSGALPLEIAWVSSKIDSGQPSKFPTLETHG